MTLESALITGQSKAPARLWTALAVILHAIFYASNVFTHSFFQFLIWMLAYSLLFARFFSFQSLLLASIAAPFLSTPLAWLMIDLAKYQFSYRVRDDVAFLMAIFVLSPVYLVTFLTWCWFLQKQMGNLCNHKGVRTSAPPLHKNLPSRRATLIFNTSTALAAIACGLIFTIVLKSIIQF